MGQQSLDLRGRTGIDDGLAQKSHIARIDAPASEEMAHPSPLGRMLGMGDQQCSLPLAQVAVDRLAQCVRVAEDAENVIAQLIDEPERCTDLGKFGGCFG